MSQKAIIVAMTGAFNNKTTNDPSVILNSVCAEGWELVATLQPSTDASMNMLIFKRPATERVSLPKKPERGILDDGNGRLVPTAVEKRGL